MEDWSGETAFEVDLLHQLTVATDHKGNQVEHCDPWEIRPMKRATAATMQPTDTTISTEKWNGPQMAGRRILPAAMISAAI